MILTEYWRINEPGVELADELLRERQETQQREADWYDSASEQKYQAVSFLSAGVLDKFVDIPICFSSDFHFFEIVISIVVA